jgi:hypothetical protein
VQLRRLRRPVLRGGQLAPLELSPMTRQRLQALMVWQHTGDWRLAAQVFGLSRATLLRWRGRYQPRELTTLEARSRRPRRVPRSFVPSRTIERMQVLRTQSSRWGGREAPRATEPRRPHRLREDD